MSKGTIVSGGTDGLYQIQLKPDNSKIDEQIAKLWLEIADLNTEITEQQAVVDDLESGLQDYRDAVDDAIKNLEIAKNYLGDDATSYLRDKISSLDNSVSTLDDKATERNDQLATRTVATGDAVDTLSTELGTLDVGGSLAPQMASVEDAINNMSTSVSNAAANYSLNASTLSTASSALDVAIASRQKDVSSESDDVNNAADDLENDTAADNHEMRERMYTLEDATNALQEDIQSTDPSWGEDLSDEFDDLHNAIDNLNDAVSYGDDDLSQEINDVEQQRDRLNRSIDARDGDPTDEVKRAEDAVIALASESQAWESEKASLALLKAKRLSKTKRISLLEDVKLDESQVAAWCADYTTDLSGDVGLIEIDGQDEESRVIVPGHGGDAVYDVERDGCWTSPYALTPSGVFVNWAVKPGWQKWRPIYKTGTITAIDYDNDTCSVDLDLTVSNCQDSGIASALPTYGQESLSNVPISYMWCNAGAFVVSDHVVVEFDGQDPQDPIVIGFVSNPVLCLYDFNGFACQHWLYGSQCVFAAQFQGELDWDFIVDSPLFQIGNDALFDIYITIGGYGSVLVDQIITASISGTDRLVTYWTGVPVFSPYWAFNFRVYRSGSYIYLHLNIDSIGVFTAIPEFTVLLTGDGINEEFTITPGPVYPGTYISSTCSFSQSTGSGSLFKLNAGGPIS